MSDHGMLAGKVTLVTGAASGIGRAAVELFAREGARVLLVDLREDGETVAARLREEGLDVYFHQADITVEMQVETMIAAALQRFGGLDCAVNNAGIVTGVSELCDLDVEGWNRQINVNLTGVALCLKHELRAMRRFGKGAIVNTASMVSHLPLKQMAGYVASKHGVAGLTKVACIENLAAGIRVNAVLPGFILTGMTTDQTRPIAAPRAGLPQEVAEAMAWLCSDRASYVSGALLTVDHGESLVAKIS